MNKDKIAGIIIDTPTEFSSKVSFSGGASYVADFSGNKIFQSSLTRPFLFFCSFTNCAVEVFNWDKELLTVSLEV